MLVKHKVVIRSNTNVEFKSLSLTIAEMIWLQFILSKIKIDEVHVLVLFINNINAKYLVANLVMHSRTKHIGIYFYFIRDLVVDNN